MSDFKARIGRDVPPEGKTRVVFSIRTSRGARLELDGVYDEAVVLKAWGEMFVKQGNTAPINVNQAREMPSHDR